MRKHGISELLVRESWLATHLTGGVDGVLLLHCIDDVRDRDPQLRQFVRLNPKPHRILPRSENLRLAHTVQTGDGVVQVDIRVVAKELGIVGAIRGK